MNSKQAQQAQEVVEHQVEALMHLDDLAQERTLERNPAYRKALAHIRRHIVEANARACCCWFPRDTLGDLEEAA